MASERARTLKCGAKHVARIHDGIIGQDALFLTCKRLDEMLEAPMRVNAAPMGTWDAHFLITNGREVLLLGRQLEGLCA